MSIISRLTAGKTYTGLFVEWIEEWSQFFEHCNWRTFRLAHVEFEDDRIMGGVEATVVFLGVGARVRWNYAKTTEAAEIESRIERIRAALDGNPTQASEGMTE